MHAASCGSHSKNCRSEHDGARYERHTGYFRRRSAESRGLRALTSGCPCMLGMPSCFVDANQPLGDTCVRACWNAIKPQ